MPFLLHASALANQQTASLQVRTRCKHATFDAQTSRKSLLQDARRGGRREGAYQDDGRWVRRSHRLRGARDRRGGQSMLAAVEPIMLDGISEAAAGRTVQVRAPVWAVADYRPAFLAVQ